MSTIDYEWESPHHIVALGEPLLELQPDSAGGFKVSIGGDVANIMITLSRLVDATKFDLALVTSLGTSLYSEWLRRGLTATGIRLAEAMIPGEPGIYGISPDPSQQPASSYWREHSSARTLFSTMTSSQLAELAPDVGVLIVTGITLALCSVHSFETLCHWIQQLKPKCRVIFDTNFRPAMWRHIPEARRRVLQMERLASVLATSAEDEKLLWNAASTVDTLDRNRYSGREVIIRAGKDGCWIGGHDTWQHIPAQSGTTVNAVGAGDSHLAGYIAARLSGRSRLHAAQYANRVAGVIIRQPGSAPDSRTVMPGLDES
jgi:2-dehydro-3-deoxygluconokinase